MRWLLCLVMFYFIPDSLGDLCAPFHRARCCDPEVLNIHITLNHTKKVQNYLKTLQSFTQGGNKRYRIRAIFKSEEGCPPFLYKCVKPRTGRDLVWEKQESDTFKGRYIYLNITLIENACLYFFAGLVEP